jgi:hypothetical protein
MSTKPLAGRSTAAAKFLSVSQADIEDRLIAYFVAGNSGTDPASMTVATDLKLRFNYSDASWAAFADW